MTADEARKLREDVLEVARKAIPPADPEHVARARAVIDAKIAEYAKGSCNAVWVMVSDLPAGISDRSLDAVADSLRQDGFVVSGHLVDPSPFEDLQARARRPRFYVPKKERAILIEW